MKGSIQSLKRKHVEIKLPNKSIFKVCLFHWCLAALTILLIEAED